MKLSEKASQKALKEWAKKKDTTYYSLSEHREYKLDSITDRKIVVLNLSKKKPAKLSFTIDEIFSAYEEVYRKGRVSKGYMRKFIEGKDGPMRGLLPLIDPNIFSSGKGGLAIVDK